MSSMEEPLLPLVQHDQKYTPKEDKRRSRDVPSRCATSFRPNSSKANFSTPNHLPSTNENTNIVSASNIQRVCSSPSIFTSSKETPCADEIDDQRHATAAQYTPSIARQAIMSIILYNMTNVEGFKGKSTFNWIWGQKLLNNSRKAHCHCVPVGKHACSCEGLLVSNRSKDGQKKLADYKMDPPKENGQCAVSKSDFVIYKLKEMGKVDENDITMISDQFDQLEFGKRERIPLTDIIGKL